MLWPKVRCLFNFFLDFCTLNRRRDDLDHYDRKYQDSSFQNEDRASHRYEASSRDYSSQLERTGASLSELLCKVVNETSPTKAQLEVLISAQMQLVASPSDEELDTIRKDVSSNKFMGTLLQRMMNDFSVSVRGLNLVILFFRALSAN
jgi:hypothetical protein